MATSKAGLSYFSCGRRQREKCSSHDCTRPSEARCQHPVKVKGETTECLRHVCRGCVVVVDGKTFCAAHGRAAKAAAAR